MATSQLVTDTKKFDGMIVDVITDLRKKHKRADCESIHKENVKSADFSNTSKEDLMNRINTLLIDEKIPNKRNRNLVSYTSMKIHPQTTIVFHKHLIITFYLILPLTIKNQFSLLLRKYHQ